MAKIGVFADLAQTLAPSGDMDHLVEDLALMLRRLQTCITPRSCTFLWYVTTMVFGPRATTGFLETERLGAWQKLFANFSIRLRQTWSQLLGSRGRIAERMRSANPHELLAAPMQNHSAILVCGHSAEYFHMYHVKPFVQQLKCYAQAHDIRFIIDAKGPREQYETLGVVHTGRSRKEGVAPTRYFLAALGAWRKEQATLLQPLVDDLNSMRADRLRDLLAVGASLAVLYDSPDKFTKVWAIQEHLQTLDAGQLLIYLDADITIRPDSYHRGLVELLLKRRASSNQLGHVFLADTWLGIDCVNSGFIALRNTPVAHLFVELWKAKMWWAGANDQASLAEAVLELVGAEMWMKTGGRTRYNHDCLPLLVPGFEGRYPWATYCHCWQEALATLIGHFRQRRHCSVSFVDPEYLEVNFAPNNLFHDHHYQLDQMWLVPQREGSPVLDPFMVHWAGLQRDRLPSLVGEYFQVRFGTSFSQCPRIHASWHREVFGTQSRAVRCCLQLNRYPNRSEWPWTLPDPHWELSWWGCNNWRPIGKRNNSACWRVLGLPKRVRLTITPLL